MNAGVDVTLRHDALTRRLRPTSLGGNLMSILSMISSGRSSSRVAPLLPGIVVLRRVEHAVLISCVGEEDGGVLRRSSWLSE